MSMRLSDLSDINRRILVVLKDIHCGGRRHIAELSELQPNQVSPALNRLEVMGFIDHPASPGMGWTITEAGYALFGLRPPAVAVDAEPDTDPYTEPGKLETIDTTMSSLESEPEPEPEPEPAPVAGPFDAGKSADIMAEMEIELALEQVRGKLRAAAIPASTARVYREILSALPPVLAKALVPLTALVDTNG